MANAPDPLKLLCSLDGEIMPVGEARISITDEGLIRGDGAFEMLKLYDNRPFALVDHLDRMERSAEGIFLEWDRGAFEREIRELLEANRQKDGELRLVLTRGGRRIAIVEPPHLFEHGLSLSTVPYEPTVVLTGLKTLSYAPNMKATRLAQREGADDALLVRPNGTVLEAPTSTIFWVDSGGDAHPPEIETGILAAIPVERLGEMGCLGAPVAEQYGGRAFDCMSYGLVVEGIGRADSSARTVVSVQTSLVAGSIEQWGTEEQKREILPKLCSAEWLGCFGLTEPGTGSDAASVATRATRKNGNWSISGSKMFISLGNHANLAMIFAQTDPEKKHRGIACFLVPTDRPGFTSQEIHGKLGLRAAD